MKDKAIRFFLAFLICLSVCSTYVFAYDEGPDLSQIESDCIYLVNMNTGTILAQRNEEEPHAIASLTKMMTALLLFESGYDPNEEVTVPAELNDEFHKIREWDGAYLDLKIGEVLCMEDLLYGMLLPSTNDCASVIAWHLAGSLESFVDRMNERADQLGCLHTHFSCPHGLYDDGNYSTASDLALIVKECLKYPEFIETVTSSGHQYRQTNMHGDKSGQSSQEGYYLYLGTTIQLQNPESPIYRSWARGIKTGFTDQAGRCLITVADDDGCEYLLILLGVPNKKNNDGVLKSFEYAADILDEVIADYSLASFTPESGNMPKVPLSLCESASVVSYTLDWPEQLLLLNNKDKVDWIYDLPEELSAPIEEGCVIGTVSLVKNGEPVCRAELRSAESYKISKKLYAASLLKKYKPRIVMLSAGIILLIITLLIVVNHLKKSRYRRTYRRRHYRR